MDSPGFARLWESMCKTLGEDLQGFTRLWERICKDSHWERIHEDSQGFDETLGEYSHGFTLGKDS